MSAMSVTAERAERIAAIEEALARVRTIEAGQGVTRKSLENIREVMIGLSSRTELFPVEEFPIPEGNNGELFEVLSVDDDGRFELYLEVADRQVATPAHNHTTWAVVTGIRGLELNRIYEGDGGPIGVAPPRVAREVEVRKGSGVCLMPNDYHSIHIEPGELNMHLHLYGLGFAYLKGRKAYNEGKGVYESFDDVPA
ncbi:MAG: cysteine dioxygenase [Rhodospirillales bacterium]|nr:cysteine dioxygenase [Rhodospirillales bacterium]